MDSILELKEFFVEGHDHDKSHVILHITEPSATDVKKGYFFGLAEIKNGSREEIIELEKIFDDLEKTYYNTQNTPEKNSLELSLEFINRRAHEILGGSEAEIHCFVGVLENFHLIFSTHGLPVGRLFYAKDGTLEHLSIVESEEHPRHFFSSLTEGDLHVGDSLLIATPKTEEFFSMERLEKLILTRSTAESVEHIQKVLKQLRSGDSYGGVLLHSAHKNIAGKAPKRPKEVNRGSVASIDSLVQKEKETATTLAPPLFHETRERMKAFLGQKKEEINEQEGEEKYSEKMKPISATTEIKKTDERTTEPLEIQEEKSRGDIILSLGKILVAGVQGILFFFVAIFRFFRNIFVTLFYLITNRHEQRGPVLRNFRLVWRSKMDFIRHLPLLSKILFSIALLSLIGFVGSAGYLRIEKKQQAVVQNNTNLMTAIEEKKNAAEASLLYNDTERAFNLVQEANMYIAQLPTGTPEDQQKVNQLKAELEATVSKLQKMTVVNAELIVDLTTKNPTAQAEYMIKLNNTLIINGSKDTNLYTLSLDTKEVATQLHDTLPPLSGSAVTKEQDKIVFIAGTNGAAEFTTKTKALSPKDISFPLENVQLKSLTLYNRRLYALDTGNNQIFKHNQTLTGYDKGALWITDTNADIKNAVSITIDGDVYVLKVNGSIVKLSSGKLAPFETSGIIPGLTAASTVWTSSDAAFIYILEPITKRIVVITKEGKFEKQFTSPQWTAPSSFVVDEKAKKMYVLDGNKVYAFGL